MFLGDIGKKLGGHHTWMKFYLDEKNNMINDYSLLLKSKYIITCKYSYHQKNLKNIGGFMIEIDPITEFCIYTIAFVSNSNNLLIDLNEDKFTIKNL